MTKQITALSDNDRSHISHALRMAAERYRENILSLMEPTEPSEAYMHLAQQFERQRTEALELAEMFESAKQVIVQGWPDRSDAMKQREFRRSK